MAGTRITETGFAVQIEGLKQFSRALKLVNEAYPDQVKAANNELAKAIVALARDKAGSLRGSAGKAAKSLRAGNSGSEAAVFGGGARAPFFFGAEFGSIRYKQFPAWRGNQWTGWGDSGSAGGVGYFLHPTIREHAQELIDTYMDRLAALHALAFPSGFAEAAVTSGGTYRVDAPLPSIPSDD